MKIKLNIKHQKNLLITQKTILNQNYATSYHPKARARVCIQKADPLYAM